MITTILWVLALYPLAQKWFEWTIKAKESGSAWKFYPMAVVMIPLDIVFNLIWGTILFRELPREFLFSTRVERHYRACPMNTASGELMPRSHQDYEALYWADWLNKRDPRHIHR